MWSELDTPSILVDQTIVERNLQGMAAAASARGLTLRPHTKTHKSPLWARQQVQLGAEGIMVAKLGEAETMLDAGIRRQSIGFPIIGQLKEDKLVSLVHRGLMPRVSVDSISGVDALARVYQRTGIPIEAIIEVDTGMHRCGVLGAAAVVDLADYVRRMYGVHHGGITCFGGHIARTHVQDEIVGRIREENQYLSNLVKVLQEHRLHPTVISEGGTVPAAFLEELTIATEIRPGTYVYNDAATVESFAATWDDCALSVLTTVVSKPAPNRVVLDAGSKTLSSDGPVAGGYGAVWGQPDWRLARLSEEHGVLESPEILPWAIGDRIRIVPNHACTTINLHDMTYLIRHDQVAGTLPTLARGKVQ